MRHILVTILTLMFLSVVFSRLGPVNAVSSCATRCPFGEIVNAQPGSDSQRTNSTTSTEGNYVQTQIYAYEARNQSGPLRYQDGDQNYDYYLFNVWSTLTPAAEWYVDYGGSLLHSHWTTNITVSTGPGTVMVNKLEPLADGIQNGDEVPIHLGIDLEHISFGLDYTIHFGGWQVNNVSPHPNEVSWEIQQNGDLVGNAPARRTYSWGVAFGVIVPEGQVPRIHAIVLGAFTKQSGLPPPPGLPWPCEIQGSKICNEIPNTFSSGIWYGPDPDPDIHTTTPIFPGSIVLGDQATLRIDATNHGNSAPWQTIAVGFPSILDPRNIELENSNIPQDHVHVYPAGTPATGCYSSCRVTLQYPHFEAEWTPWLSSEGAYVKILVRPEVSGTFTFYVKSVAGFERLGELAGKWDPVSCSQTFRDDQHECIYSYSFEVTPRQFPVTFRTNPTIGSIRFDSTTYRDGETGNYRSGIHTAAATIPDSYIFHRWLSSGAIIPVSPTNPVTAIDVSGSGTLIAEFAAKVTFYMSDTTSNSNPGGSISWSPDTSECSGPAYHNEDVIYEYRLPPTYQSTFTACASAPTGYTFSHWSATGGISLQSSTAISPASVRVTGPGSITAIFSQRHFNFEVISQHSPPQESSYNEGESITASAPSVTDDNGQGTRYKCVGWSGTGSVPAQGTECSVSFTISQPSTLTWIWKPQFLLTVTANPSRVQILGVSPQPWWVDEGERVTLSAPEVQGMTFDYWMVGSTRYPDEQRTITISLENAQTATASYSTIPSPLSLLVPVALAIGIGTVVASVLIVARRKAGRTSTPPK